MRPIGIAIIGYGKIAADQHVPSIEANERLDHLVREANEDARVQRIYGGTSEIMKEVVARTL